MTDEQRYYTIALSRMTGFNAPTALRLCRELGGAKAVYDNRASLSSCVADCTPRLVESLQNWDDALSRAAAEMEFASKHNISVLTIDDDDYPARLRDCPDAPIVLFYKGNANLNQRYVLDIVGTRRCTAYGQDLVCKFVRQLREQCPEVLIVSGLAYGIDILAHRQALENGFDTVGVLAHGLDTIYPGHHRDTAAKMVSHGGLLTEYMSGATIDKSNFVRRNRIVAGMSDATIVVESPKKGGALITAAIAQDYNRSIFAFPGPVGATYSEGCNNLIRDNGASLIGSTDDFLAFMGWQTVAKTRQASTVERQLFPSLTADEQKVVSLLQQTNDLQLNIICVKTSLSIGQLNAVLFQLEMKGVVKAMAGGSYHLIV